LRERPSESDDNLTNIFTQSIRFNKKFEFENTTGFFYNKWCDAGLFFFIKDLLDENNEFLSLNRFKEIHRICTVYENFTNDTTNLKG
jgi:hypothetical protein